MEKKSAYVPPIKQPKYVTFSATVYSVSEEYKKVYISHNEDLQKAVQSFSKILPKDYKTPNIERINNKKGLDIKEGKEYKFICRLYPYNFKNEQGEELKGISIGINTANLL